MEDVGATEEALHPFAHEFTPERHDPDRNFLPPQPDRCGECGVGRAFHGHHLYTGYGGGPCMRCTYEEGDIVHEFKQERLV